MRFTLRQLQLFVAACEEGSVTLAAQREHISQSAASSAIAQLEAALGVQLLLRHHAQGVAPSPAGRQFATEATLLLAQAAELDRLVTTVSDEIGGRLDLGCLVTLAPIIMPRLCNAYNRRYPAVELAFIEAGHDELLARLRSGRIGIALTYDLQLPPDVAFQELATLPPFVLLSANGDRANSDSIALADLADAPYVMLDLPISRDYFRAIFASVGFEPNIRHRSAHPEVVKSLVANGFGYTLVNARPVIDQAVDGNRVIALPLSGTHRPMRLGLATIAQRREPRACTAFREFCREMIDPGGAPGLLRQTMS